MRTVAIGGLLLLLLLALILGRTNGVDPSAPLAVPAAAGTASDGWVAQPPVSSSGLPPLIEATAQRVDATPLAITDASGAELAGTAGPVAALAELRRLGGAPRPGVPSDLRMQPLILLHRMLGNEAQWFRDARNAAYVAADGTFSIPGIPAGTWNVRLTWRHRRDASSTPHDEADVAVVTLRDGATTRLDIDVSHLLPGTLWGTVLHNGAAMANTRLWASCRNGTEAPGEATHSYDVTTDAEGRFTLQGRAGEYWLMWQTRQNSVISLFIAPERIHVVTGQTVAQTFHLRTARLRARLLDARGEPVFAERIELRDAAGQPHALPRTDAIGWTSRDFEPGLFTVRVLPKHLQDAKARAQHQRNYAGSPADLASAWLPCGHVRLEAGATTEVELRLPADWDR